MKKVLTRVFLIVTLLFCLANPSYANVINGDFSGGLSGWTVEDMDVWGNFSPSASVSAVGEQAVLETQGYSSDVVMISLFQWFDVPTNASTISFDVGFWREGVDIDDPRGGFPDFLSVSYLDDTDFSYDMSFMNYKESGPYDVQGSLTDLSGGWFRFTADISNLSGRSGSLFFDLIDDVDGFFSTAKVDNVEITSAAAPVPEPATIFMLSMGLFGMGVLKRR